MRFFAIILLALCLALTALGQTPKSSPKKTPRPVKTPAPTATPTTSAADFDVARFTVDPDQRISALREFRLRWPQSAEDERARLLIIGALAELGDRKLAAGDFEGGTALFKKALEDTPSPIPADLFAKVILGFPISLYARQQRAAAFDVAKIIEEKVGADASQMLDLAKFFINVQYGTEAIRLAEKAIAVSPSLAAAHNVHAISLRLNFRIQDAAGAYAKVIEIDPENKDARFGLAEMKRALGKPDEALAIYQAFLEKEPENPVAKTGLVLCLFGVGKTAEAEAELAKAFEADPLNDDLFAGAAYWYAGRGDALKATEFARKALTAQQSNIWAHIALARAQIADGKPLEAEKTLLAARRFGDVPTLDYELANARLAAGFFRDAAEILRRNFSVTADGAIETYVGNRILADAPSFTELLSLERKLSIYEPTAADDAGNSARLKSLLAFAQKLEAADTSESDLAASARQFAAGGDDMRLHRQIFAASRLLARKKAPATVLELLQDAVKSVDAGLNVSSPSSAVMAEELYESRQYAQTQGLTLSVATVPKQTLSSVVRGRIEDLAGQAYAQQNDHAQAIVRFKRALSVLPEKSLLQRSTSWNLGLALQADGKEPEALRAFLRGYDKEFPDAVKRDFIERLFLKVNGNIDGLDEIVGAKTESTVAAVRPESTPQPNVTPSPETVPTPTVTATPEPTPAPTPTPTAQPISSLPQDLPIEPIATPTPDAKPEPTPETTPTPEVKPEPTPETTPTPEVKPEPTPETTPTPEVKPEPTPETTPTPNENTVASNNNRPRQFPPSPDVGSTSSEKKPEPVAETTPKPLFDPVVIKVGDTKPKSDETTAETRPVPDNQEKPITDEDLLNGNSRPRVIVTDNVVPQCRLNILPPNLELSANGGPIMINVTLDGTGDIRLISAKSESPQDLEVRIEQQTSENPDRALFVIRSISDATGNFTISFEAPCGKQETVVKIR